MSNETVLTLTDEKVSIALSDVKDKVSAIRSIRGITGHSVSDCKTMVDAASHSDVLVVENLSILKAVRAWLDLIEAGCVVKVIREVKS